MQASPSVDNPVMSSLLSSDGVWVNVRQWGRLVHKDSSQPSFNFYDVQESITIGRSRSNHFVVAGPHVGGRHCKIKLLNGGTEAEHFEIVDLSGSGTFLNGVIIGRGISKPLRFGDRLSLYPPDPRPEAEDYQFSFERPRKSKRAASPVPFVPAVKILVPQPLPVRPKIHDKVQKLHDLLAILLNYLNAIAAFLVPSTQTTLFFLATLFLTPLMVLFTFFVIGLCLTILTFVLKVLSLFWDGAKM